MFFFPFLCSAIPDLELGILKMLISVCFHNVLQPAVYKFVPAMIWLSASFYSKCTVVTVYFCYLQVLAMYKKFLSWTKSVMDKSVFPHCRFSFDL